MLEDRNGEIIGEGDIVELVGTPKVSATVVGFMRGNVIISLHGSATEVVRAPYELTVMVPYIHPDDDYDPDPPAMPKDNVINFTKAVDLLKAKTKGAA